jgi:hypothetical protein
VRSSDVDPHVVFLFEGAVAAWIIAGIRSNVRILRVPSIVFHQRLFRHEARLTFIAAESMGNNDELLESLPKNLLTCRDQCAAVCAVSGSLLI